MSKSIIQERLASYDCKSDVEEQQALREITQEVALAALDLWGKDLFLSQLQKLS